MSETSEARRKRLDGYAAFLGGPEKMPEVLAIAEWSEKHRPEWIKKAMAAAGGPKLSEDELNQLAGQYLLANPKAGYRKLAKGIDCTPAIARKLPAYRAVEARRQQAKPKGVKTLGLTDPMLATVSDGSTRDTAIERLIAEQEADKGEQAAPRKQYGHPIGRRRKL
jgi:hypothetical protein